MMTTRQKNNHSQEPNKPIAMTEQNQNKNPILNPQAEGSNAASSSKNKGKERTSETEGNFASSSKTLKETILELKSQLATTPPTEDFHAEREKIKTKITSYEIMATPAANDFLNDILAERKKLLPSQGIFSFVQILAREQFYKYLYLYKQFSPPNHKRSLPVEIINLIEEEV
jgi:hypothetical protein